MMGDGGISVAGQENIQEILTKQLLLCQFACALSVIKQGQVCHVLLKFETANNTGNHNLIANWTI